MVDPGDADVVGVVAAVLTDNGPLCEDELVAAVAARGVVLGGDPGEELDEALDRGDGLAVLLADGRWAWLPALLAGRLFTHRLSADEVDHDVLAMCPDLEPLSVLVERADYQRLADGGSVQMVLGALDSEVLAERGIPAGVLDDGGLLLPAGYLSAKGVAAGEVIGIGLGADGLRVGAGIDLDERAEEVTGLACGLRAALAERAGEPVELDTAVWTACAQVPGLFCTALPPLAEVLGGCGLSWRGDWLAGAGFDFDRWWVGNKVRAVAHRHDLDEDEALAVVVTVGVYEQVAQLYAAAHDAVESGGQAELSALLGGENAAADNDATPVGEPEPTSSGEAVSGRVSVGGYDADELGGSAPEQRAWIRQTVAATMELLAEPAVAEAVLAETLGSARGGAGALGLFAETCESLVPRRARVALRWLRAKAHERLGELSEAEQAYLDAQTLDPDWAPVLWDLARYASDRSDAARGLSLLRRAGASADDDLVALLERHQPVPRSELGRNQQCWCGSGRKYKQCHLRREVLGLGQRAGWLYQKAGMFLREGPWWEMVVAAAIERARYAEGPDALGAAIHDPLVADAVLFEGGVFAEFLATRGALLPDDERLLAQQWLLVSRSVHEVERIEPGHGLMLRDVRTGDRHQVSERSASRQLHTGDLVCARVVPTADTMQIFGGIEPVGLAHRDELIALLDSEPDPVDLVAFLTRRFAPPVLCNTEGDPLVLCEASLASTNPTTLAQALDGIYDRADQTHDPETDADPDGSQGAGVSVARWFEHVTTNGMTRLRATVELVGDQVRVHTNSEARLDRVLAVLRGVEPAIALIGQTRHRARDAREMQRLAARFTTAGPSGSGKQLDPTDPDVAAALTQFTREFEHRWLDEPVPALAGYTPRQAATDPTRRDDLTRLLGTFPRDPSNPRLMDPDRLRAELGL